MRLAHRQAPELVCRTLCCAFGVCAVIWGSVCLPVIWQQAPVSVVAKGIIAGDSFKRAALDDLGARADDIPTSKWSRPSGLASVADIHVRRLEQAIGDADRTAVDHEQVKLKSAIQRALSNAPADAYLWLVLFWLENAREGFTAAHLKYLSMSYAIGPNEGWIAVKRSRLALAVFPALPPDLQVKAISEFSHLVDSGFVSEAADILTGPGWPVRERLLANLATVDDVYREQFAKAVYSLGYDVAVPGVKPFGYRPWR